MTMQVTAPQKRKLETGVKLSPAHRSVTLARRASPANSAEGADATASEPATVPGLDLAARTLSLSFSSQAPVERWFGSEVLSHAPGAADLSRLNDGGPLLFNHNMDDVIGVVVSASIGADLKGHAVVRFANTDRANEVLSMVSDGILRNVSFMYQATKYQIESEEEDPYYDPDATYTATSWLAYEISIVSVPADQTVGVGRALNVEEQSVEVLAPVRDVTPAATAANSTSGETMKFKTHLLMSAVGAVAAAAGTGDTAITAQAIDHVAVERQRTSDIVALARKHNLPMEKTHDMLSRGLSISEARGEVLDGMLGTQNAVASAGNDVIDLTAKEKRSYSIIRAVQAMVNKDWGKAGFEREVSLEIAKRTEKETSGFFVPMNLPFAPDENHLRAWNLQGGQKLQTRAPFQVASGTGGNLVATNLLADSFIEVLRNASVTAQLGARYLTDLVGKVDIPRQSGAASVGWVGESTAGSESEGTFDKVSLTPKTVTAWSVMSRLMMLQSTPSIEMIAREDLLAVAALALDIAAMSGSGSGGQPLGIVNQSGVASVVGGTNGAALTFDHIIQLKTAPRVANASLSNMAFALNSKAVGYLETQKSTTGQYLWSNDGSVNGGPGATLKGERYVNSQQLRSTLTKGSSSGIASELLYGNWRELLIGMWGVMEIAVNPYDSTGFKNGDVILRVMQTADVGVRHGASFAAMSDALTPGF
jgi:HK97 family phage major capsid protein/HK97 family phage prohead protease